MFKNSRKFDRDKDSRFSIEKNRKRWSPADFAHRDRDKRSNILKQLSEGNERPQNQKFEEHSTDKRNDNHTSPLRSKIGVKSSIGLRNSRERESRNERVYRVHDENNRKKSCFSDIRSHNFRFDAISSSRSNSCRRNNGESESKKKTNKNADLSKKGKKGISGKDKKRFNLLENDLFRYTKQEQPKQKKKETPEPEKPHSGEVVNDGVSREDVFDSMQQDSYADVENGNKGKSPDKIENCDSIPPFSKSSRLPETVGESTESTVESILTEVSPFKNDMEPDSHQDVSDRDIASSVQNIVHYTAERDSDNENVKDTVKSEIYPSDYLSISVPEESFESDDSVIILDSPLIKQHIGNNESSGFRNPSLPDIVPLPDEKFDEITLVHEVKPLKMERWEDWENIIRAVYPEIDVSCVQDGNKSLHVSPLIKRHSARKKRSSSSSSVSEILEVKPKPVVQSKSGRSRSREPETSPSKNCTRSPESPARHSNLKKRASISPNDRHKSSPFRKSRSPLERRSKSPDKSNPYPAVSNRSPAGSGSFHGQFDKSPVERGRSASRRSESRSRSRSVDERRRRRLPSTNSTRSSSSSSESESVRRRRYTKNTEERKKISPSYLH